MAAKAVGVLLVCLSPTEETIGKEPLLALGLACSSVGNNVIHDAVQLPWVQGLKHKHFRKEQGLEPAYFPEYVKYTKLYNNYD